ncbi:hypothetical protein [Bacteroides helcogenes]|uniref:Chromosomal replication initiator DnaA C-terminal domain-containing protein n=1 Tax=Bacteroides helcogenes (strain ATCC 35417 / DSM 20613 / JCM 6297 / CCUG 15421 / P 36-108) TaxID=693979 RepID=E6SUC0_BACT6|nr:hypothetical protein [Bacteroides helcogenes]ADV42338.1 hypothetical protein Bache_0309 [Bacteroides helcogenes P 36-108]MDY5237206.1 hypothetical protein [Bacteroides helcogenes]
MDNKELNILAAAVANVTGVTIDDLRRSGKSYMKNLARGLFYYIARKNGMSTTKIAEYVCRTHSSVTVVSNRYGDYIDSYDEEVIGYYIKIDDEFERLKSE